MITVSVKLKNGVMRPGILLKHRRSSEDAPKRCSGDVQVFVLPDEVKELVGQREETKSGIFLYDVPIIYGYWTRYGVSVDDSEAKPGEATCNRELYSK